MTPPPHELEALIRAARDVAGPPPDVAARLVERLDGVVAASTAAGAAGGAVVSKTMLVLGGSALFVAGLLVGGGAVWTMRGAEVVAPIVEVVQTAPPPAPVPERTPEPPPEPEPEPAVPARPEAARPVERKPPRPQVAEATSTLEAERQLLDVARAAVMRGVWPLALEATEAHRARFPTGALAEEREVLAIQALATTDPKAAAARAAAFRTKWPSSILEAVIEKVVPHDGSSASPQ